jgi:hypothetical protein
LNTHENELRIPTAVLPDKSAVELLRVWASRGKQHVALFSPWDDPAAWGIMLVDLAKHVANAYEQSKGKDAGAVLKRIREGFDAEWAVATDEPSGEIEE